jgi:uncharacterized protein
MLYLIDGYNLLHAMGVLGGPAGPAGLEKARLRLLGLLRGTYGEGCSAVTVVFDAGAAPHDADKEQDYHGIHVCFAGGPDQADGFIEGVIQHASAPKNLAVVSDDHRIQQAARHRRCRVLGCDAYLDSLAHDRARRLHPRTLPAAKPEGSSTTETSHWLEEFAELTDSRELKELSDPYEFLEGDA